MRRVETLKQCLENGDIGPIKGSADESPMLIICYEYYNNNKEASSLKSPEFNILMNAIKDLKFIDVLNAAQGKAPAPPPAPSSATVNTTSTAAPVAPTTATTTSTTIQTPPPATVKPPVSSAAISPAVTPLTNIALTKPSPADEEYVEAERNRIIDKIDDIFNKPEYKNALTDDLAEDLNTLIDIATNPGNDKEMINGISACLNSLTDLLSPNTSRTKDNNNQCKTTCCFNI